MRTRPCVYFAPAALRTAAGLLPTVHTGPARRPCRSIFNTAIRVPPWCHDSDRIPGLHLQSVQGYGSLVPSLRVGEGYGCRNLLSIARPSLFARRARLPSRMRA